MKQDGTLFLSVSVNQQKASSSSISTTIILLCVNVSSVSFSFPLDIDDCQNNSCQANSSCVDKLNGYDCICPAGLKGIHCQSSKYIVSCRKT